MNNEVPLKQIVDDLLKKKQRSLSWLAEQMNKTFDGLKLSVTKGSIKYNDLLLMAEVLGVEVSIFIGKKKPTKTVREERKKELVGYAVVHLHLKVSDNLVTDDFLPTDNDLG